VVGARLIRHCEITIRPLVHYQLPIAPGQAHEIGGMPGPKVRSTLENIDHPAADSLIRHRPGGMGMGNHQILFPSGLIGSLLHSEQVA
jgi:hypothetical protein